MESTDNSEDELVVARAEEKGNYMECFIVENGAERKAGIEDLLPIIEENRRALQLILREANKSKVDLALAFTFLPDDTMEIVYRNVSPRVGDDLKKQISELETYNLEENYIAGERAKLMDFIWRCRPWFFSFPKHVIWKKNESKEEKAVQMPSPLELFKKRIEKAFFTGELDICNYTGGITHDDIRRQLGEAFQNHKDDPKKIQRLSIWAKDLPAVALLFEKGEIEGLTISCEFDNEANESAWPSFLENCHSLTDLELSQPGEIPSWVRSAPSLRSLSIDFSQITSLPDWIGDLQSLTSLQLSFNERLETLPDSIGNLKNLDELYIYSSPIKCLPDSMGNLKNLRKLFLKYSLIEKMPEWLGDLQSLAALSLDGKKTMKALPDSIGNLKNLVYLDISGSCIEKLPGSIVNCTALESVNISGTKIGPVPDSIKSLKNYIDKTEIEIIPSPAGLQSISYRCFCNSYYELAKTLIAFNDKARREGLLALEDELGFLADGFFKLGMRLIIDGTDAEYIRDILQTRLERENDFYRKKLMEVALKGILRIQAGDNPRVLKSLLASLVNMENNPLDAALVKYLDGDFDALTDIDFSAAIQDEEEREEIGFLKRALKLSGMARREGLLALEEYLDREGIAARDVFEYGLVLVIDGWDPVDIGEILDNLITHETDPVRKNISQAKKKAVLSIMDGDNPRIFVLKICAFFDESIAKEIQEFLDE